MTDTDLRASLSRPTTQDLADMTGGSDPAQTGRAPTSRPRQRSPLAKSPKRPRARVGGVVIVMTISSLLLAASSMFFGYRAISGRNAISSDADSIKADRETSDFAQAPNAQQVQSGDTQTGVTTSSISGGPMPAEQQRPDARVITPVAIRIGSSEVPSGAKVSPGKQISEVREAPPGAITDQTADRKSSLAADTQAESNADRIPDPKASPILRSGFAVQIASERSQQKAQAAFRRLQTKFPSQLHGNQAIIRRADVGAGTYYRALAGPFASRDGAFKLCRALKAAGGDCIVQKI
jgi:hypothetical protein